MFDHFIETALILAGLTTLFGVLLGLPAG